MGVDEVAPLNLDLDVIVDLDVHLVVNVDHVHETDLPLPARRVEGRGEGWR
jgi:hypothetical protein